MPNWCSNNLIVKGPKKDLDAFKATLNTKKDGEDVPFSFAQTHPAPPEVIQGEIAFGETRPNWYTWNSDNWGTKWDACEVRLKVTPLRVNVWFDTAWAPPLAWLKNVSAKFPNLTFTLAYNECGMSFYGVAEATGGVLEDNGGEEYADGDIDEDGNPKRHLKKHVHKYALGMGG